MTKPDSCEIVIVLDRSGSMEARKDETIGGFNGFLEDQQTEPGECRFTLTQFDNEYEVVLDGVPIKDVPRLTPKTYVPRGTTALLDAIGRTINVASARLEATPEDQRPSKVLFVVLTDGHENASVEFKRARVFEMVKEQETANKWTFVFIGTAQDQIDEAGNLGFTKAAAYDASQPGSTSQMYSGLSGQTCSLRAGRDVDADAIAQGT